jgi:hypothetical protein
MKLLTPVFTTKSISARFDNGARAQSLDAEENPPTPNSSQRYRLQVSRLGFVILAATFLSLINGPSLWQRTSDFFNEHSGLGSVEHILVEIALLWCSTAALVLLAAFHNSVLKFWTGLLVCVGVFTSM